jgi:hypothetical protein
VKRACPLSTPYRIPAAAMSSANTSTRDRVGVIKGLGLTSVASGGAVSIIVHLSVERCPSASTESLQMARSGAEWPSRAGNGRRGDVPRGGHLLTVTAAIVHNGRCRKERGGLRSLQPAFGVFATPPMFPIVWSDLRNAGRLARRGQVGRKTVPHTAPLIPGRNLR